MEITHKSCFFFVFRVHFHYVLSYLFGLFGVRTCVSILWHTSLPKNATLLEKIAKKYWRTMILAIFGDFRVFDMTSLMTSLWRHTRYVCTFFWYQWTWEGHSYPLVPHTWYFVNRFPRSWGGGRNPHPRLWDGSKKPGSFRVKCVYLHAQTAVKCKRRTHLTNHGYFDHVKTPNMPSPLKPNAGTNDVDVWYLPFISLAFQTQWRYTDSFMIYMQ